MSALSGTLSLSKALIQSLKCYATCLQAYEDWMAGHADEPPLPGVPLTSRQLFFMGFAQVWCSVTTPEAAKLQVRA